MNDWIRTLTAVTSEVNSELFKVARFNEFPQFQPFLQQLLYTIPSPFITTERRQQFKCLENFENNFMIQFANEMDAIINDHNLLAGGENNSWSRHIIYLSNRAMKSVLENSKMTNDNIRFVLKNAFETAAGKAHLDVIQHLKKMQILKENIENDIRALSVTCKIIETISNRFNRFVYSTSAEGKYMAFNGCIDQFAKMVRDFDEKIKELTGLIEQLSGFIKEQNRLKEVAANHIHVIIKE